MPRNRYQQPSPIRQCSNLPLLLLLFVLVVSFCVASIGIHATATDADAVAAAAAMEETAQQECSVDGSCTATDEKSNNNNNNNVNYINNNNSKDDSNNDNNLECINKHEKCVQWADSGECDENPNYMLPNCPKACHVCSFLLRGGSAFQREVSRRNELKKKKEERTMDVTETPYGVAQTVDSKDSNTKLKTQQVIQNMTEYMVKVVFKDPKYKKVKKECKNRHSSCAFWVAIGECDANPSFMTLHCAPSCQTCHLIDFEARCPFNASEPSFLQPGDLDRLFIRLTTDEYYVKTYQATIHSMPNPQNLTDPSQAVVNSTIKDGPWVVTLENFISDEECDRLIELGGNIGYEQSRDVGSQRFDGTFDGHESAGRTSTNAWCTKECYNDTLTQNVLKRIENLTGVPDSHSEYLQLLRYEPGQFYRTHHDYIVHQTKRQEGVRILTVFLYLNNVEAGGGTNFPDLGITVHPKRGRALIWPSVLNERPDGKDPRTRHEALPVEKGIKFGANAWLHQRDFKSPFSKSCH